MTWNNYADYDLPQGILSGIADLAFAWNEGGSISLPTDRPIRFFFDFREPMPWYAAELMADLRMYVGKVHQSNFQGLPITVTGNVEDADAVITFYLAGHIVPGDTESRLDYVVMWTKSPEPGGGSFHVR